MNDTRLEALGYDQLNIPDHLASALAVMPTLTVAAAATTRLRVSGLVFANDYRNSGCGQARSSCSARVTPCASGC